MTSSGLGVDRDRRLSLRGRWLAITAGSVVLQFSYWSILAATAAALQDGGPATGVPLALGFALMPLVFMVLAFGSRHPRAPGAVLKAMGLFIVIGLPATFLSAAVGLVAGYGAGGIVALRPSVPAATRQRWIAVAAATVYILALLFVLPSFAVVSGAVLPFAVLGLVDQAVEGRAAQGGLEPADRRDQRRAGIQRRAPVAGTRPRRQVNRRPDTD